MKFHAFTFEDSQDSSFSAPQRASTPGGVEAALKFGQRAIACLLMYLMIPLGVADVFAQQDVPPPPPPDQQQSGAPVDDGGAPPQNYNTLGPDQLNQLVAPIALYPDALVAQVLAASTFPSQVVEADRFVQSQQGAPPDQIGQQADGMQWDPSVKALIAFPSVLANLDKNLDWTSQLGNAYYNQPQDVMAAVQVMRQRAYDSGNLRPNSQLAVDYEPGNIVIAPANPAVVYVPYYNPWSIYGGPLVAWPGYYVPAPPIGFALGVGIGIGFGVGIAIGGWNRWGWGWHNWGVGWGNHSVFYQHNTYISRSVTVVNHGYYGRFDRNPGARAYNRNMAMHAPAYRGGNFNRPGGSYNRPGGNFNRPGGNSNRPGNNNFNRPGANGARPGGNNNFNRPSNGGNLNRPGGNTARPGGATNYNRPGGTSGAYNRPGGNTARPGTPSGNSRPGGAPAGRPATQGRPSAPSGGGRPSAGHAAPASHGGGGGHAPHGK
jgi:Protein of unknown function (DUF3300)